jgi:hypothetical protein
MPKRKRPDGATIGASQTIVTGLHCKHYEVLGVIQDIQRKLSESITLATKLGSLFILKHLDSKHAFHPFFLDRTFWRWCFQMVTLDNGKATTSSTVRSYTERVCKPPPQRKKETDQAYEIRCTKVTADKNAIVQKRNESKTIIKPGLYKCWVDFKAEAQAEGIIIPQHDRNHLGCFVEDWLASYITNVKVYMSTTVHTRMAKAVGAQVRLVLKDLTLPSKARTSLHGVLMGYILNKIQGRDPPNWQERKRNLMARFLPQDAEEWSTADRLVLEHKTLLPVFDPAFARSSSWECDEGLFDKKYIQAHATDYIPYLSYLATYLKRSCAILPQWDAKARYLRFNACSFFNFFMFAKKVKKLQVANWLQEPQQRCLVAFEGNKIKDLRIWNKCFSTADIHQVFISLFELPRINTTRTFQVSMMTNGITANWLLGTLRAPKDTLQAPEGAVEHVPKRARKERKDVHPGTKRLSSLKNGLYFHGQDFYLEEDEAVDWLFVDPGHSNLMVGCREDSKGDFQPKTAKYYKLTNAEYQTKTGMRKRRGQSLKRRTNDAKATVAWQALADHSSKTWDPGEYQLHLLMTVKHWSALFHHAFRPYIRHFRFANYQARQRIIHKIATDLCLDGRRTILVVGNGVAKATSKGKKGKEGKGGKGAREREQWSKVGKEGKKGKEGKSGK